MARQRLLLGTLVVYFGLCLALGGVVARANARWETKITEQLETIPDFRTVWEAQEAAAVISGEMMECFWKGQTWLDMVNSCCKTLYLGPGSDDSLKTDLALAPQVAPAKLGLPPGVRYSYFLGHGNDIVVNGGAKGIEFLNFYLGWDIQVIPLQQTTYRKQAHTYRLGDPEPPQAHLYEFMTRLPEEVPPYEGMTVVDTTSLPDSTTVVMDNWPSGQPTASPCFISRLNQGLPMKVTPSDCPALAESDNLKCQCGHVVFLGWNWEHAKENVWDHSLVFLDQAVSKSCGETLPPPVSTPAPPTTLPPAVTEPPAKTLEEGCKTAPEYDPAAKNFYYKMPVEGGGQQMMVKHWCQSNWIPQEAWYRYQRYLPETNNNLPPPPINDYDFLNAYAPKAGNPFDDNLKHLENRVFDDFTLGNTQAQMPQKTFGYTEKQRTRRGRITDEENFLEKEEGPWMKFQDNDDARRGYSNVRPYNQ